MGYQIEPILGAGRVWQAAISRSLWHGKPVYGGGRGAASNWGGQSTHLVRKKMIYMPVD